MLFPRPWLSARDLIRSPWARIFLVALALAQMAAPNWNLTAVGGTDPAASPTTRLIQGFLVAAGPGRQAVICVAPQVPAKPLKTRALLRFGLKLTGKSPVSASQVTPFMPERAARPEGLFGCAVSFRATPLTGPQLLFSPPPSAHSGRAPPLSIA